MEIEKHFEGSDHPMWTIHGAKLNPNYKLPIKDTEELIELYNLILHELGEAGILNVESH